MILVLLANSGLQSSLFAITCCRSLVLASASEFVSKPESWLHMLSKYRATATAAPNFAYEIVAKKLSAKQQIKLDLSSVRLSLNGAEPLRWGTIEKYQSTFARFGWRATAMCPVYGLAESTLIVTGAQPEECVKWIDIDRAEYAKGFIKVMRKGEVRIQTGEEFTKTTDQGNALRLVACGSPVDCEVAIVCPEERVVLRQGRIGEIWVRGDRVCVGYDNDEEATNATFRGVLVEISISNSTEEKARECKAQEYEAHEYEAQEYEAQEYEAQEYEAQEYWLRTGDLGFFHDGLLFISSRLKVLSYSSRLASTTFFLITRPHNPVNLHKYFISKLLGLVLCSGRHHHQRCKHLSKRYRAGSGRSTPAYASRSLHCSHYRDRRS